ncbi:hypothetical protein D7Z54_28655 [Salibacterium salarium]|uniref:Tyr recombinase domain-containing protein n=1 Tax=Salibacterium salarium TaxID=284579 RepID=A0A3R9P2W8_9BACI|nr:ATP-binding protein [Salibacterium salarium]RSL29911.1 hypothetical protein D7Z54_28655 [Salibacterium salarium]
MEKRLKWATFPVYTTLDDFSLKKQPSLTQQQFNQLVDFAWLDQLYNFILLGPTGAGKITLAIGLGIKAIYEGYDVQNQVIKRLGEDYYDQNFIFAKMERQFGYPIVIKNVRDCMKRLLAIANLSDELTPHSLRHTHTSLLAEVSVSLEQIMDRLGHTDDQITKNVYLHVTEDIKKEASQKFSELMRSLD